MKQTGKVTALKHLSSLFTLYMQAVVTEKKLITSEMKKVWSMDSLILALCAKLALTSVIGRKIPDKIKQIMASSEAVIGNKQQNNLPSRLN